MKIRNGFVSNSSSASFVVKYIESCHKNVGDKPVRFGKTLLSEEEVILLRDYGFRYSCNSDPFDCHSYNVDCDRCDYNGSIKDKPICWHSDHMVDLNLRFDVSCNENEPINFLLKHDIPFICAMNYDCQLMVYKRGMKNCLTLQNDGIAYLHNINIYLENKKKYFDKNSSEKFDFSGREKRSYPTAKFVNKNGVF